MKISFLKTLIDHFVAFYCSAIVFLFMFNFTPRQRKFWCKVTFSFPFSADAAFFLLEKQSNEVERRAAIQAAYHEDQFKRPDMPRPAGVNTYIS